jgi:hypothetical protein
MRRLSRGPSAGSTPADQPYEDTALPPRISTAPAAILAAALGLGGCGEPAGPDFEPRPETAAAPRPMLAETALLRARLEGAGPEAERLAGDAAALEARAEALRARARALTGPVVEPGRRPQLLEAAEGGSPP